MAQSFIAAAGYWEIVLLIWKAPPERLIPGDVEGPKLASIRRPLWEAMTKAITRHGRQPVIDNCFPFDRLHEACGYFR